MSGYVPVFHALYSHQSENLNIYIFGPQYLREYSVILTLLIIIQSLLQFIKSNDLIMKVWQACGLCLPYYRWNRQRTIH